MSFGFIKIDDDASINELEAQGVEIQRRRGDILLASFPTACAEEISASKGVRQMQLSRDLYPKLDKARQSTGVSQIHSGIDLPQAYTGKGVICGIVDGGMDPNHINFKDDDGNARIKSFAHRRINDSGTAMLTSTYTPEQLPQFSTDASGDYHGTHTMGIMAGGYRGNVRVANASGKFETIANPYYGVAYGADIAASCGELSDYCVAYGVEGILDYAYEQQKPAVINLSLGGTTGPHDGNGLFSQYLELAGQEAIICLSAGNEGDLRIHITKTFTEDDTELQTFISPYIYGPEDGNIRYGAIDIYSADDSEFDVQGVVYSKSRDRITFRMPISGNTGGEGFYYVSSTDYGSGIVAPNFEKAFNGYFGLGSMLDQDSNRFYALLDYYTEDNRESNADGNYMLGFIVSGKPGQRIDVYCDGVLTELTDEGYEGWTAGSSDGSISDLATSRGCIAVGSYNTRDSWVSLDGNAYGYNGMFPEGTISLFSSYGTLIDGRQLPHICAPGATVISSTSTPFVNNPYNYITNAYLQASVAGLDRNNYWQQTVGTSMASPFVAGTIALWLEADPTLTTADVLDIIQHTATVDNDVLAGNPVQWGAGKFNAYEGLKEVLHRSGGVANVAAGGDKPLVTAVGQRSFRVFSAGSSKLAVKVYDMAGRCVATETADADTLTIDLSGVGAGVYIVSANGSSTRLLVK